MGLGVNSELSEVGIDDLLAAVGTLPQCQQQVRSLFQKKKKEKIAVCEHITEHWWWWKGKEEFLQCKTYQTRRLRRLNR